MLSYSLNPRAPCRPSMKIACGGASKLSRSSIYMYLAVVRLPLYSIILSGSNGEAGVRFYPSISASVLLVAFFYQVSCSRYLGIRVCTPPYIGRCRYHIHLHIPSTTCKYCVPAYLNKLWYLSKGNWKFFNFDSQPEKNQKKVQYPAKKSDRASLPWSDQPPSLISTFQQDCPLLFSQ